LTIDTDHIGEREMTRTVSYTLAALATLALLFAARACATAPAESPTAQTA
jgi:hypothetical protein